MRLGGKFFLFIGLMLGVSCCSEPVPPWEKHSSGLFLEVDTETLTDQDTDTGEYFDCENVPDTPVSITKLEGPLAYHDIAFNEDGHLVAASYQDFNVNLVKSTYDGDVETFLPDVGLTEGLDYLSTGELIVSTSSGMLKVQENGATEVIDSEGGAVYLTIGPDEMVYVAVNETIARIDPENGTKEILWEGDSQGWSPNVVNFSPDHSIMYIGTITSGSSSTGEVWAADLNSNMNMVGDPYLFAQDVGEGWHDGLGVDACGNLYVPDMLSRSLYRVSKDGDVVNYIEWTEFEDYGHGVEWGLGIGGWRTDAIYLPQPYNDNTVVEVVIGVPKG